MPSNDYFYACAEMLAGKFLKRMATEPAFNVNARLEEFNVLVWEIMLRHALSVPPVLEAAPARVRPVLSLS